MSPKRKKIKRVLELRDDALIQRARALEESRARLKDAMDEHARESEQLVAAEKYREKLASAPTNVGSWIEAEQWLAKRKVELNRANGRVVAAETHVETARQCVLEARIDKKRIELLDERMADGELRKESRIEQRLTDELARRNRRTEGD